MNAKISKTSETGIVLNVKNNTSNGIIVLFDQTTGYNS